MLTIFELMPSPIKRTGTALPGVTFAGTCTSTLVQPGELRGETRKRRHRGTPPSLLGWAGLLVSGQSSLLHLFVEFPNAVVFGKIVAASAAHPSNDSTQAP